MLHFCSIEVSHHSPRGELCLLVMAETGPLLTCSSLEVQYVDRAAGQGSALVQRRQILAPSQELCSWCEKDADVPSVGSHV